MFAKNAAFFALVGSIFGQVAAHGFVPWAIVGSTTYQGFDETTWTNKRQDSPILITDYLLPLYDVGAAELACGTNAQAPALSAPINAGETVQWKWNTHNDMDWVHTMGTHRSFIASCNGDCKSANPTDLNWIELSSDYTGPQNYDPVSMNWPVEVLHDGGTWSDKIPNLPAGQYLLRNELTALHYSDKPVGTTDDGHDWGTEFYPTCVALEIQGTDGSFQPGDTYKFPGAYQVNEPGHYNPNIFTDPQDTVIAALFNGQGYTPSYSTTPTTNDQNNQSQNTGGTTPASNDTPTSSGVAAASTPTHGVCAPGMRRSLSVMSRKMRRAHKAVRRSEH